MKLSDGESRLLADDVINSVRYEQVRPADVSPGEQSAKTLTLQEVLEYLQNGLNVPGADDITVIPSNEVVSEPKLIKPKKPWE